LRWTAIQNFVAHYHWLQQTPHTGPVPSADALKVVDEYFAWRRTPVGEAFVKP